MADGRDGRDGQNDIPFPITRVLPWLTLTYMRQSLQYLATVDILHSLLSEEEINIVIILQHLHKVWS